MILKFWFGLILGQFTLYGGGKGGSAPDAPDPYTVANATTQTNNQSAAYSKALNLNNFSNPFGSQSSQITGTDPSTGAPIYGTSTTANPALQAGIDSLLGQAGQSGAWNQYAQTGLNNVNAQYGQLNSALGGLGSQLNQGQAAQAQAQGQQAAYNSQTQYLDPQFSQQQESLNASLANQGLTPGSQAYNNAQLNQSNAKQQAYSNAANQAILTGTQVGAQDLQNQVLGINTQAGLLGQAGSNLGAQGGLYGQSASLGQLPYSNLQSLASLVPGYTGTAQTSTTPANIGSDVYSSYQGQLNNYNAQQQSANQALGGLFGLGSAGLLAYGLSDRRIKRDIKQIGVLDNGLPWYEFRLLWDRISDPKRQGVMSDEVRRVKPEAVSVHVAGFDMVDYKQLAEV